MKVKHVWDSFNVGAVYDWEFEAPTEDECVFAAYERKEALRGTEDAWVNSLDEFHLWSDNGLFDHAFYL